MATIEGANIVRNGLVLNLDAANPKSYPGSGTAWSDLSGNGNTGTLTNGPTFSSTENGSIVFDGVDDYVTISDNASLKPSVLTSTMWVRKATLIQVQAVLFTKRYAAGAPPYNSYSINQDPGTGSFYNLNIGTATTQYVLKTPNINDTLWHSITMTYDNAIITGYVDGINIGTVSAPGPILYSTLALTIAGSANWGGTNGFKGNISNLSIYNRALSASEVAQNYNATKARYGL